MENRILIAYASKYGSTAEIAEYVGQVLRNMGIEVDVSSVNAVNDISQYENIIIGSATRMDKLLSEAVKFATKNESKLRRMKTAYFIVGVTMKQNTPENREKVKGFLEPLYRIREPVSIGLFAGKIDYSKVGFSWKVMAKLDKSGLMEEGDFRNWDTISKWANEIAPALTDNSTN